MGSANEALQSMTREELYRRVWDTPISKLAVEFGIRASDITRLCEGMKIPRPTSSHWTFIRMGRAMVQSPLMELDQEALDEVQAFRGAFGSREVKTSKSQPEATNTVVVADELKRPHQLVAITRSVLRSVKPNKKQMLAPGLCRGPTPSQGLAPSTPVPCAWPTAIDTTKPGVQNPHWLP